jgi:hypothetical protein
MPANRHQDLPTGQPGRVPITASEHRHCCFPTRPALSLPVRSSDPRRASMGLVEDDQKRCSLRAGFDEAPEAYHRTRPVCPPQAFDDLVSLAGLAGLAPGDRVAEIGCGTGQATVPLAIPQLQRPGTAVTRQSSL